MQAQYDWKFDENATALQVVHGHALTGKYAVVTGANAGIGYETTRALVSTGCHVVLGCRDLEKGAAAVEKLKSEFPDAHCEAMRLDLASFSDVKHFADEYLQKHYPLHYLVLNAGIMMDKHQVSKDGYELTYQTNYLAQFYLTQLLQNALISSAPSRVVVLSSLGMERLPEKSLTVANLDEAFFVGAPANFEGAANNMLVYRKSKALSALFALELHRRVHDRGVAVFYVQPGFVYTQLVTKSNVAMQVLPGLNMRQKTAEQAAATPAFCVVGDALEPFSGLYFGDCRLRDAPTWIQDETLTKHLWTLSEALIAKHVQ